MRGACERASGRAPVGHRARYGELRVRLRIRRATSRADATHVNCPPLGIRYWRWVERVGPPWRHFFFAAARIERPARVSLARRFQEDAFGTMSIRERRGDDVSGDWNCTRLGHRSDRFSHDRRQPLRGPGARPWRGSPGWSELASPFPGAGSTRAGARQITGSVAPISTLEVQDGLDISKFC